MSEATNTRRDEANTTSPDVIALVIAARDALETEELTESAALWQAVEAFSSRVCYDDEGGSLPEAHADPCTCGRLATAANPEGMKAWSGGDTAPADWDGGPVLLRNGYRGVARHWGRGTPSPIGYEGDNDIIAYTPQTSDGTGPGSWAPAEQLVQANERIAELEGVLDEALDFVALVQAFIRRDAGTERMADTLDNILDSAGRVDTALRAKGWAA